MSSSAALTQKRMSHGLSMRSLIQSLTFLGTCYSVRKSFHTNNMTQILNFTVVHSLYSNNIFIWKFKAGEVELWPSMLCDCGLTKANIRLRHLEIMWSMLNIRQFYNWITNGSFSYFWIKLIRDQCGYQN